MGVAAISLNPDGRDKLYLSCSPDGKLQTKADRQEDEALAIEYHGDGRVTIRSRQHGYYLTANQDGSWQFDSPQVHDSSYFKVVFHDDRWIFLESAYGQWLEVDESGMVICKPEMQNDLLRWERLDPESLRAQDDKMQLNRKADTIDNSAINPVNQDIPMGDSQNENSSRNNQVRPTSGNGLDAERPLSETSRFFILSEDELEQSDVELVVLMIAQFKGTGYQEPERLYLNKLIDKLSEFPELRDLNTDEGGLKIDQFTELQKKFRSMDYMFFDKAPDNLHKLYHLLWVKITDINSGCLDSNSPSSLIMEGPPKVKKFCS